MTLILIRVCSFDPRSGLLGI